MEMKQSIKKFCNIIIVCIIPCLLIAPSSFSKATFGNKSSYQHLFQTEQNLFNYSIVYENESVPGFEIYIQAIENASEYPIVSYNLLITCYTAILSYSIEKNKILENITAINNFLSDTQNNLSNIKQEIYEIEPLNIASMEWLELAKRELYDAEKYFNEAKNAFTNKVYNNSTIAYLLLADTSIHKAKGFLSQAMERNKIEIVIPLNIPKIYYTFEKFASRYIELAEYTINFYENLGYQNYSILPRSILNQTKTFYSNKLYYITIMNAAYAKALMEYNTQEHLVYTNFSQTLSACENYSDFIELIMSNIRNISDIDAPFAETLSERSKIHLQESLKEEDKEKATTIARLSIQESLIAKEQARVALELRKSILEQTFPQYSMSENAEVAEPSSQETLLLLVLVIIVETILLVVLWYKKR